MKYKNFSYIKAYQSLGKMRAYPRKQKQERKSEIPWIEIPWIPTMSATPGITSEIHLNDLSRRLHSKFQGKVESDRGHSSPALHSVPHCLERGISQESRNDTFWTHAWAHVHRNERQVLPRVTGSTIRGKSGQITEPKHHKLLSSCCTAHIASTSRHLHSIISSCSAQQFIQARWRHISVIRNRSWRGCLHKPFCCLNS